MQLVLIDGHLNLSLTWCGSSSQPTFWSPWRWRLDCSCVTTAVFELSALSPFISRAVNTSVAREVHGSSSLKIATLQYKCGTRSALWQLHLENRNLSVQVQYARYALAAREIYVQSGIVVVIVVFSLFGQTSLLPNKLWFSKLTNDRYHLCLKHLIVLQ